VDLLIVGGPNHAFGMSRPSTREQAAQETDGRSCRRASGSGSGWRRCRRPTVPIPFAAFDSRADKRVIRTVDRTAGQHRKRLRKRGLRPFDDVQSFLVEDMKGPLVDGELDRARAWGPSWRRRPRPGPVG
jgi:hypothetical protein